MSTMEFLGRLEPRGEYAEHYSAWYLARWWTGVNDPDNAADALVEALERFLSQAAR